MRKLKAQLQKKKKQKSLNGISDLLGSKALKVYPICPAVLLNRTLSSYSIMDSGLSFQFLLSIFAFTNTSNLWHFFKNRNGNALAVFQKKFSFLGGRKWLKNSSATQQSGWSIFLCWWIGINYHHKFATICNGIWFQKLFFISLLSEYAKIPWELNDMSTAVLRMVEEFSTQRRGYTHV